MKRIFSRKRKDYRLFAAALAFGFTASTAAILTNQPSQPVSASEQEETVQHVSATTQATTNTATFAYASPVGATAQAAAQASAENVTDSSTSIFQPIRNAVQKVSARPQNYLHPITPAADQPLSMTEVVEITKGDTLNKIFEAFDIPKSISLQAIDSLKGIFSPRHFRIGQQVTLLFKPSEEGGREFLGYRFAADPISDIIVLDNHGKGEFDATVVKKELQHVAVAKKGIITGSLMGAAARAGVPRSVVNDMINVYSHSVDFQRDLKEGDRFEVMYRAQVDKDGKAYVTGDMLYARLTLSGKEYPIYRYEGSNGHVDYLKPDGTSNRRGLMRTPIEGARMTSGYGVRRHPILGYSKMHKGVDFGARRGTPIFAAGDGVIARAGWFGAYGNYIKINHNAKLATAYAHMHRLAKGMRPGVRVKQGQIIGYVGTTGRSTGPHLHYEVMINGAQVNPVGIKVPTASQLAGAELKKFKASIAKRDGEFKQAMSNARNQTASR